MTAKSSARGRQCPALAVDDHAAVRLQPHCTHPVALGAVAQVGSLDHLQMKQSDREHGEHQTDQEAKQQYAPSEEGLVAAPEDWPGLITLPGDLAKKRYRCPWPRLYVRLPSGDGPRPSLKLTPPPCLRPSLAPENKSEGSARMRLCSFGKEGSGSTAVLLGS